VSAISEQVNRRLATAAAQVRYRSNHVWFVVGNVALGRDFFIGIVGGVESYWVHSVLRPPMAYCASPGWLWWWINWWDDWQEKPKYSDKTCPTAALSTTNPTCCPDPNPGLLGGKPASNRLSYGTVLGTDLSEYFGFPYQFSFRQLYIHYATCRRYH
jgi:hypothetical protein